jgi:putative flippase GtrA
MSSPGVITVDSDGQHDIEDIKKVASEMIAKPDSLILGVRQFTGGKIPFRSRFGNQLTKKVLALASGLRLSDTQTGLRGIPSTFLQQLLNVKGDRFEYEMNMLLQCKTNKVSIQEVSIQTIYIEENRSSHFQPVKDSLKIYSVFFKYSISSLSSFGIDIIFFYFLSHFLKGMFPHVFIVLATIGARILSALFNYSLNRNAVFHQDSNSTMSKYFVLVIAQMLFSGFASTLFYYVLGKNGEVLIKIAVDTILFFGSYTIQKKWVFASKIKARPIS